MKNFITQKCLNLIFLIKFALGVSLKPADYYSIDAMHEFCFNHYFITVTSAVVIAAMAVVLLGVPIPSDGSWQRMRQVRTFLATSFLLLSGSNMFSGMASMEAEMPHLLSAVTLAVASFQALLFTATAMVFIGPMRVRVKVVLKHCGMIAAGGAILILALFSDPGIYPALFCLAVIAYICQLIAYWRMFHASYRHSAKRLDDYYDDEESGRLRWLRHFFYSALAIGLLALAFSVFEVPVQHYDWFTVTFTVYYVYVVMCVINYRINYTFVVKAVGVAEKAPADKVVTGNAPGANAAAVTTTYDAAPPTDVKNHDDGQLMRLEQAIDRWVQMKKYTQKDVSPDDVAEQLGTNRRYLAWYFTTQRHTTFRSWRLKLRIAEAERLLRDDSEVSTASLHDMVGVGDKSNFHKQFKLVTGMTPSEYKAAHGKKKD